MEYIECEGLPNVGYCTDNDCPCSVTQIQHGTGYLYISPEVVTFRRNALSQIECRKKLTRFTEKNEYLSLQQYEPILICEKGAKRRNLDLNIAAKDARVWWETQKAPLRATPFTVKADAKNAVDINTEKPKRPSSKQQHIPYINNEKSSVDVVSQFAGTPLEELALKMNKNANTTYKKSDYSTTDTAVPYKSRTDTFHKYDNSIIPHQPDVPGKKGFKKPSIFMKFIKNSIPIVLTVLITAFFSFIILKFEDIKYYVIKNFESIQEFSLKVKTGEETIIEEPDNYELTRNFFNNFYSFKDNRYHGTIQFKNVTDESGNYKQEVFVTGKANKFIVTGSFAYNNEKIVFRPNGKNRDVIWMLRSLHLDSGEAFFYDPIKEDGEESEISLEVKRKSREDKIIISSDPAGASIILNDSILGQTPLHLKNPKFHGLYQFIIEKEGYNTENYEVEFTGGVTEKFIVLTGISDSSDHEILTNSEIEKKSDSIVSDSAISFSSNSESRQSIKEQTGALGTIFLSSLPPKADVYMDGVRIGITNEDYCRITAGTHTMKFVKGTKELVKKMTFTAGRNPSQLVHLE